MCVTIPALESINTNTGRSPVLAQCWPGISGTDPALKKRNVNSYFRNHGNWYYVTKGEVGYAYTCDN